ncbi:MAG: glycerol-3-phosphate 1-O-acyltransferase PlsY [Lachnospiraceae bacterium]|nr:glycerol-3-phosphate 1-O-acyltransferase PlsY [Lachnospiraceae bacterium]
MLYRILSLAIGYAFGLFQTSYLIGKRHGVDIRTQGSGNAGTTNALRTMGKKTALIVMLCDVAKCVLATLVVHWIFGGTHPEIDYLLRTWAGLGAVLGHNYPFYMGFKGGKGVACIGGFIISISPKLMFPIGLVLFFGIIALTHYVSLSSLCIGVFLMTGTVILGQTGSFGMPQAALAEMYVLVAVIVGQMYYRHRENIGRLLHGTERKTYIFGKEKKA